MQYYPGMCAIRNVPCITLSSPLVCEKACRVKNPCFIAVSKPNRIEDSVTSSHAAYAKSISDLIHFIIEHGKKIVELPYNMTMSTLNSIRTLEEADDASLSKTKLLPVQLLHKEMPLQKKRTELPSQKMNKKARMDIRRQKRREIQKQEKDMRKASLQKAVEILKEANDSGESKPVKRLRVGEESNTVMEQKVRKTRKHH